MKVTQVIKIIVLYSFIICMLLGIYYIGILRGQDDVMGVKTEHPTCWEQALTVAKANKYEGIVCGYRVYPIKGIKNGFNVRPVKGMTWNENNKRRSK